MNSIIATKFLKTPSIFFRVSIVLIVGSAVALLTCSGVDFSRQLNFPSGPFLLLRESLTCCSNETSLIPSLPSREHNISLQTEILPSPNKLEPLRKFPVSNFNVNSTTNSYEVCLLVAIGDDTSSPNATALPFNVLHRLFEAVLRVAGRDVDVEPDVPGVLVGVDYTSFVCNMVRDALGPSAECRSFQHVSDSETQMKCRTLIVGVTTKHIQQPSLEWENKMSWENLQLVDLDADDPAAQAPSLSTWRPTVVTGFSRNHLKVALLLLRNVGKVASDKTLRQRYNVSLVVWALEDFNEAETQHINCVIREINEVYHVPVEFRRFDFSAYPVWMRINASLIKFHDGGKGEYAWKAILINKVLQERGFVLWMDGGGRILTPDALANSLDRISDAGFASRYSEGDVETWTHPGQLKYMRANTSDIRKGPNCDASVIGFTLKKYSEIGRPWYECSMTRQCIAPDGSDRYNHRQDQAALSVLSGLTGNQCQGIDVGLQRHMDQRSEEGYEGVDKTECYEDPLAS